MKVILTALLTDPLGTGGQSQEEEYAEIKENLKDSTKGLQFNFYTMDSLAELKPGTDLICFDYGGMYWGNSLGNCHARDLIQFAQDNPSSVVLILTTFTNDQIFRREMKDLGLGELHNVFYMMDLYKEGWLVFPEWFTQE